MKKYQWLPTEYNRRRFIVNALKIMGGMVISPPWPFLTSHKENANFTEPLHDWSLWEEFRDEINHPALTIKEIDLNNALENIKNHTWAKNYLNNIVRKANHHLKVLENYDLELLIEETTPGDPLWTPCPSCREKGNPVHPHGSWQWNILAPDQLKCKVCSEVFPHTDYPEDKVLKTSWGKPQTITYYGGETFTIFGFKQGLPSFTANIRSRKVQWAADASRTLAEAYLLTKEDRYAQKTKELLLRLASCYPNWLVHVGYGEYADMDPKEAALHINELPQPEITPPPNHPDYKLWTGFWSAGRASGVGLESDFIRKVVEAYDFTCEARTEDNRLVYHSQDKTKIEKDLLLESTVLLVCDKKINNKSVSNRTAVALVGICVGHPELVRFGLEGFEKTVYEWFLSDGATSESPFYGLMTLGGIWDLVQATRNYSDPKGFTDKNGSRIDHLNVYKDPQFGKIWQAFYMGLQGDLSYPSYADSFPGLKLDSSYVELMAANYPNHPEYLALLKEICGNDLSKPSGPVPEEYYQDGEAELQMISLELPYDLAKPQSPSSFPLYYRKPEINNKSTPELKFESWNPPDLRIAHLRTGTHGRESLVLLSASHWGIHHEKDSLNISYWKNGVEILSDLGYLWDHPLKPNNIRTLAHNTVLIDEKEQIGKGRKGEISIFQTSKNVRFAEANSAAYDQIKTYNRKSVIIDHGNGQNYLIDVFDVEGGQIQDYVFHINDLNWTTSGPSLNPTTDQLYDFKNIKSLPTDQVIRLNWQNKNMNCQAWIVPHTKEKMFIGEGWGQRDWEDSDIGRTIPYIVRRTSGQGIKTFISLFEGQISQNPFVKSLEYIKEQSLLKVETGLGTDYISWSLHKKPIVINEEDISLEGVGKVAVISTKKGEVVWSFMA